MTQIKRFLKRLTSGAPIVAKYLASQHLGILALLVSIVGFYFTYFRHIEDFRVYLRFPEPLEVGSAKLHLNYFFSNRGNEPVLIEDVSIIQLWMNSKKPNASGADFSACDDPSLYRTALLPLKNMKPTHVQMKNGELFSAFWPVKTFIDGIEGQSSAAAVEPGKMKAIATMFEPEPMPRDNYNAVVICPVIRFFDSQGRPVVATCKGWQSTWPPDYPGGTLLGPPPGGPPAKLLPISSAGSCRSVRVAAEPS